MKKMTKKKTSKKIVEIPTATIEEQIAELKIKVDDIQQSLESKTLQVDDQLRSERLEKVRMLELEDEFKEYALVCAHRMYMLEWSGKREPLDAINFVCTRSWNTKSWTRYLL